MGYHSASLLWNLGSAKTRVLVFFSGALGILGRTFLPLPSEVSHRNLHPKTGFLFQQVGKLSLGSQAGSMCKGLKLSLGSFSLGPLAILA